MANNRMMLRCKNCKEVFMLAKYYPVAWGARNGDLLDDWFEKHDKENEKAYKGDLGMEAEFYDLVYENSCDDFIWPHLKSRLTNPRKVENDNT